MYNKTKQIFVASLVALALVGMNCSNSNDGGGSSTVAVTGVSLDKTSEVIDVDGGSTTLTATVLPSNASNQAVTWKSSDDTVATIDPNGKVTAVKVGTATITVTTDDGGFTASATIKVSVAVTFKTVVAGGYHTLAISTDDKLYAWGYNEDGQLGDGTTTNRSTPKQVMAGTTFKTVVAGYSHSFAISTDDKLYAWGYNGYGRLGDGSTTNRSTPQLIEVSGTTFQTVVANGGSCYAISTDGKLYAWGYNEDGQLGNGTTTNSSTPKQIMAGIKTVVAGYSHSLAISTDDKLYAWGKNQYGQLGNGKSGWDADKSTPQLIEVSGTTFQTVVAGGYSSYAISTDDKLYAWGSNYYGQLGDGTTTDKKVPTEIKVGTTFKTVVAATGGSSYAISTDGKLYAWGKNDYGQLGNGTTNNSSTPKQIMAGTTFQTVVAGYYHHSLAISTDGRLYTWGKNDYGQLGDGSTTNSSTPKQIMAGIKTVVAGEYHTLAISTDGKLYTWGKNDKGQLGNGNAGSDEKEVTPQLIEVYE